MKMWIIYISVAARTQKTFLISDTDIKKFPHPPEVTYYFPVEEFTTATINSSDKGSLDFYAGHETKIVNVELLCFRGEISSFDAL